MNYRIKTLCFFVLAAILSSTCFSAEPNLAGKSPLDELPPYIKQLTYFGERADWSHDGRFLAFHVIKAGSNTKGDIWILPLSGDRKPYPFLSTNFDEVAASFSPDGRWLSYTSDESGRSEVYVVPFPGPGGKWQVSTGGGTGGGWSRDGREIIYGTPGGEAAVVEVKPGATGLEVGAPKILFKVPAISAVTSTADFQRILLAVRPEGTATPRVALVTNWTEALGGK